MDQIKLPVSAQVYKWFTSEICVWVWERRPHVITWLWSALKTTNEHTGAPKDFWDTEWGYGCYLRFRDGIAIMSVKWLNKERSVNEGGFNGSEMTSRFKALPDGIEMDATCLRSTSGISLLLRPNESGSVFFSVLLWLILQTVFNSTWRK